MTLSRVQTFAGTAALAMLALGLGGCRSDFSADIRNMTPQPVTAQVYEQHGDSSVILGSARLGPGDRGVVGPVRGRTGRVNLVLDTMPNPRTPYQTELRPGANYFNVRQLGDATGGPLQVEEVTR